MTLAGNMKLKNFVMLGAIVVVAGIGGAYMACSGKHEEKKPDAPAVKVAPPAPVSPVVADAAVAAAPVPPPPPATADLAALVAGRLSALQDVGLERLGEDGVARLRGRFASSDHPGAREIVAWLDGAWKITRDELEAS